MKNFLIAKRNNDKLYYDSTIETPFGRQNLGRVVRRDGKHVPVNIDETLSRSNWDVLEPQWQNSIGK